MTFSDVMNFTKTVLILIWKEVCKIFSVSLPVQGGGWLFEINKTKFNFQRATNAKDIDVMRSDVE